MLGLGGWPKLNSGKDYADNLSRYFYIQEIVTACDTSKKRVGGEGGGCHLQGISVTPGIVGPPNLNDSGPFVNFLSRVVY